MAKLRLKITKGHEVGYVSHLDLAGTIERAVRRAKLSAAYSEGFNPHMKLAFASALAVGVTSEAEYLDIELTEKPDIVSVETALKAELPAGIEYKAAKYIEERSPALMAVVNLAAYDLTAPVAAGASLAAVLDVLERFNSQPEIMYVKQSPKGRRQIDIKEYLATPVSAKQAAEDASLIVISLSVKITPTGSVKPAEVLGVLRGEYHLPVDDGNALIHRTGLYVADGQGKRTPLEL